MSSINLTTSFVLIRKTCFQWKIHLLMSSPGRLDMIEE